VGQFADAAALPIEDVEVAYNPMLRLTSCWSKTRTEPAMPTVDPR
jgi:hypothetical protein